MPDIVDPIKIQNIVRLGFDRMNHMRKSRAMFFKSYMGKYACKEKGVEGDEPLNLVFHTIRSFVPNLVMQSPLTQVTTPYIAYKGYAELLGMGLDTVARQIKLKQTLRGWITNALFGWGIIRTGIKATGEVLQDNDVFIDNGQVYASLVLLDNFGFDPTCTDINKAKCLWDMVTVPRQWLLDTDGYDHDAITNLPSSPTNETDELKDVTQSGEAKSAMVKLQDEVDVVQMYVPEIEQIVLMGDPRQKINNKFITIQDYNGPKEGPYTFLSFSPPVEGNPFPVAPVGIWYDLAVRANRVMNKTLDQIEEQKDITLYNPSQVDELEQLKEAVNGDFIPSTDPKGFQTISIGGQNPKNEVALQELQTWYNYMSGNPDQIAGSAPANGNETATKTMTLQNNATVGLEDMRDIVYDQTAEVMRRIAWYLHTDPLIDLPLTKRKSGGEEVQLSLTPEQRMGDFLDYAFKIVSRSMTKMDPMVRSKRIIEYCTNIIPSGATTAQVCMQIGVPFNLQRYYTNIGFEMGIGDWVEEFLNDPEYAQKLQIMMMLGPGNPGKAGGLSNKGVVQNGGSPMNRPVLTPGQEFNQRSQEIAAQGQSINQGAY